MTIVNVGLQMRVARELSTTLLTLEGDIFSFQKKVRKLEERKLVTKKYRTRGRYSNDESLTMECLKSWLLQIFVNVFD